MGGRRRSAVIAVTTMLLGCLPVLACTRGYSSRTLGPETPAAPPQIACFNGASGYRYGGSLSLNAGNNGASQLGSLANLLQNVKFSGAYVASGDSSIIIKFPSSNGSQDLELRRVGGKLFQRAANGPWETSTGTGPIISTVSTLDPQTLCRQSLAPLNLSGKRPTVERVNDVQALHYTFGPNDLANAPGLFGRESRGTPAAGSATPGPGTQATLDVWLDPRTAYPARMQISTKPGAAGGESFNIRIDVTDVNAPNIAVAAPTP